MIHIKKISLLLMLVTLTGCATTFNYPIDKYAYRPDLQFNYSVAINNFQDLRPDSEQLKDIGHEKIGFYTNDETFKNRLNELVAESLAQHLKKTKVFHKVNITNFPFNLEDDPDKMKSLLKQGYDYAITAVITHCVGFQLTESSGASVFGALGVLVDAMANQRTVGAKVVYNPIKVIDLKNQSIIWQDMIEYSYEKEVTFYLAPATYARRGVRSANNEFIENFVNILDRNQ